ncbi:MAG: ATP synthase F0 subunit B [Myxococcota bacterium]
MRALCLGLTLFFAAPVWAQHGEEAGHAAEAAHAGHGEHDLTAAQIWTNTNFLFTCLTFLFLIALLRYGYFKAGKPALEARRREIEEALNEAQAKKAEAEALREEYRGRLSRMEEELAKIREQTIKAGEVERDRIVAEAEAKAATMRKDTAFQIEQKMKALREELTHEAVAHAVAAAEEVIKNETTAADQTRLADAYLDELGALGGGEQTAPAARSLRP